MTTGAYNRPALSITALSSFICGIVGCIPFLPGLAAVILGIIGFLRTGNPAIRGRWMAIVGILLGLLSVGGWTAGTIHFLTALRRPGIAVHDFMHDLAAGDMAGAKALSAGLSDDDLRDDATLITSHGTFIDTTFNNVSIMNSDATVTGSTTFNTGSVKTEALLTYTGGSWKVTHISFPP